MAMEDELEINGDVLETVLSHVPLVDLVAAMHVSKPWSDAVSSSLRHHNKLKPWLILHTQATRHPYATATHAYDPRSDVWIKVSQPSIKYISALKSSHSNFLYMLSPSQFSFSFDPLNFDWHHVEAPMVWRNDPIVARVGDSVVVAGGGCDFEDDPLAVEIYDLNARVWHTCDSMPMSLRDSAASIWLSIATTSEKLIVTHKESGVTHWLDPVAKSWSRPFVMNPSGDDVVTSYNIGCTNNNGLILVGVCRNYENVERVKVWGIVGDDFGCEEIGEMPLEFVESLRSESFGNCGIHVRVAGDVVYVYSTSTWEMEVVVACELVAGGGCRWWSVRNVVARDGRVVDRLIVTCSEVGIDELRRVMGGGKDWRFEVSSRG
ncbi:hypothetical protein BUALT_Bualt17G0040400 [Buddleja alternifolia]|uniref:F-box domain-containing protein n=1 Tax=Buddleja alternifolia TaxID=168488 RepID=A0AAV6W6M1_9LAMI|nr:hypothetical protein BUALT_Bualt17G0040400 [Buddleja alternifolia]